MMPLTTQMFHFNEYYLFNLFFINFIYDPYVHIISISLFPLPPPSVFPYHTSQILKIMTSSPITIIVAHIHMQTHTNNLLSPLCCIHVCMYVYG